MSAIEIKNELRQMIENERDLSILEAIRIILQKTSLDPILKDKLTSRALKSESDIDSGFLFSKDDVRSRTQR